MEMMQTTNNMSACLYLYRKRPTLIDEAPTTPILRVVNEGIDLRVVCRTMLVSIRLQVFRLRKFLIQLEMCGRHVWRSRALL